MYRLLGNLSLIPDRLWKCHWDMNYKYIIILQETKCIFYCIPTGTTTKNKRSEAIQTLRGGCSKADPQTHTDYLDYNTLRSLACSVTNSDSHCKGELVPAIQLYYLLTLRRLVTVLIVEILWIGEPVLLWMSILWGCLARCTTVSAV